MILSDRQWAAIERLFPRAKSGNGRRGRPARPFRDVLNGILWVLRTGAPWADMPSEFPPYTTCFGRFRQWSVDGTLRRVVTALRSEISKVDDAESFIDGSYVQAKKGALVPAGHEAAPQPR